MQIQNSSSHCSPNSCFVELTKSKLDQKFIAVQTVSLSGWYLIKPAVVVFLCVVRVEAWLQPPTWMSAMRLVVPAI